MPTFTHQQFSDKWERASYQGHFMDVCRLVDHPTPAEKDPAGEFLTFEAGVKTASSGRMVPAAGDFVPHLDALHRALDRAVCDAYGWEYDVLDDEEEILRRLLALNLERAAGQDDG